MIVEDDEAFGYLIEKQLLAAGHQVTRFLSWVGVLESLEAGDGVDLLVTDLRLPAGTPNGASLARMALARRPNLKVIYMTAFAEVADDAKAVLPAVLIKSDDASNVVSAIEDALAT